MSIILINNFELFNRKIVRKFHLICLRNQGFGIYLRQHNIVFTIEINAYCIYYHFMANTILIGTEKALLNQSLVPIIIFMVN